MKKFIALTMVAVVLSAPAFAGDGMKDGMMNNDQKALDEKFAQLDINQDGTLGASEIAKAKNPEKLAKADIDNDGMVSKPEMQLMHDNKMVMNY